jgi:signal transduction histidine kinase
MVGNTGTLAVLVVARERERAEDVATAVRAADERFATTVVEPDLVTDRLLAADVDFVLGDLALPAGRGRRLLDVVGTTDGVTPVVVTASGDEELAADAVRYGAADYRVVEDSWSAAAGAATERALADAEAGADRAERLDSFVRTVSHDVRNPLAVARGWLDVYRESDDEDHWRRVEGALVRIEEILDDLEALARAEDGAVDEEWVELSGVATAAWEVVDTGDAELAVEYGPELNADRTKLQEALENLFRNAVEHGSTTPRSQARGDAVEHGTGDRPGLVSGDAPGDDGLTVRVGVREDGDGVYVADDGRGIPEHRREAVFEPGVSSADDGTGFGLAIVQRVAAAHGWSVTVGESAEGGARFDIVGPAVETPDERVSVETRD